METNETPLQQAKRHLAEGDDRISKQEALIVKLVTEGPETELPAAQALLASMHQSQALGRQHLARELAKVAQQEDQPRP
ncbi:hypothetical protein [Muricoccus radiodurans]|uniref:hypothetical protein n=1 Tax=Muricoccus radiodurans TaxID=2231721 RepID=UPI003CFB0F7C